MDRLAPEDDRSECRIKERPHKPNRARRGGISFITQPKDSRAARSLQLQRTAIVKISNIKPPSNARRIYRWADLPGCQPHTGYIVENDGQEAVTLFVRNKRQRVLEGLMRSPLYAASYTRLSDHVDHLKRSGVVIETLMFRDDPETGRDTFGIYVLRSRVTRIEAPSQEVAA